MPIRRFALAALFLLAFAKEAAETQDAQQEPQWREFHFPERGFVASFPGLTEKPKPTSMPVAGQNPLLQHTYQANVDKDTVYSIVVFEYPEGRAPNPPRSDYFAKVVAAYAKGSDTKVLTKRPTTFDRRPGYEAVAEDGRGKRNHLISLVANGDRIYMIVSAGPKGHGRSENAERFRDDFRLLGGPPPPHTASSGGE
jgi:hypothetical protein